jgi:DNA-binding beta-propeller fold protein YncE
MRRFSGKSRLAILLASTALALPVASAQAAVDPLFVHGGGFDGPCGLAVDSGSNFYVADYHQNQVEIFNANRQPLPGVSNIDPIDGPCGLGLDFTGKLYVNDFHRSVIRFTPSVYPVSSNTTFSVGPVFGTGHPTGVAVDPTSGNVYVNERTQISVYGSGGALIDSGIGLDPLADRYGLAISEFPGTSGRLYVADAATETVEVYAPAISKANPVATLTGPPGGFSSLRDSALAVDRVTGKVYVADNLQPRNAERPEAAIYVFGSAGAYLGRLKHNVIDALPPGLAVDNSVNVTQGRVYVTSGNSENAGIYAYTPGAETSLVAPPLPGPGSGGGSTSAAQLASVASRPEPAAAPQPTAGASELTQQDNLRLSVTGKLSPRKLPREGSAPIAVSVGWNIATIDGSLAPKLKRLGIEINRNGRFDYTGLPTCPIDRIHPASTSRALANCRSALVGQGRFTAEIALRGQEAYSAGGRLLVFNGERNGKPVLLGQIYSPRPFATSFVIVFAIEKQRGGTFGTALKATLPKALISWGNLTGIEMTLSRRYGYEGQRRSYISAGCPAPKGFPGASFPLARTTFDFEGGLALTSTLTRDCKAR